VSSIGWVPSVIGSLLIAGMSDQGAYEESQDADNGNPGEDLDSAPDIMICHD
jgi:hypothetical protein